MVCSGGSIALFKAGELAVVGHVANDFVFREEAEGLLFAGSFEPVLHVAQLVLTVQTGLGTGPLEGVLAMMGQQLVDELKKNISEANLQVKVEETGGTKVRSIVLDVEKGKIVIE